MHAASLNHVFRLVWSDRLQAWVAVAEGTPSQGKGGRGGRAARMAAAVLALAGASGMAMAAGASLPTGGQVVQGSGSISQSGYTLTVNQGSARLVTNWQSFNVGAGQVVQFNQPSANAVALNRVLGSEVSNIQGALRANGQVFLLNPNGVLFGATARVDTGGLVASTLSMSDADFMAGRYHLAGDSTASVINQGQILVRNGGGLALVAAKVVNQGELQGDGGLVGLASGNDVTLDFGGAVQLQVNRGALDSLIENGGAVRADGGHVVFTAKAADALSRSVINQTGVVRARTLSTGAQGEIELIGDMDHGQLKAGGQIDASAPDAGNGGHIETSAAEVETLAGLRIDAGSRLGQGGTWLIDPYDYTINATAAGNIATALNSGTNVTVTTQSNVSSYGSGGASSGNGDITVSSAISKTSGGNATLTLRADRNIAVNSAITSSSGQLGITLSAANNASSNLGGVNVAANLTSNGGRILIGGAGGNQTAATSYGIGYALNTSTSAPAVTIGTSTTISSAGGDITINGRSSATNSGSYSATKGGIYVLSGATVDSGGGMLYMSGISAGTGADKVFGFGVEASSNTVTTFKTSSTSGAIVVDAQNATDALGALGLVNNGSQARVQFWAPSVAHMLFRINGNNKATTFTQSPPCNPGYPNCGTMVIPGGNQSYTSAGYNVVNMAMVPLYIFSGSATRVYDGTTNATGMTLSSLGGPNGFVTGDLGALGFNTPSKAVGSYTSVSGAAGNPANYTSGGTTYAVAYYNQGTYTITQKTISSFSAGNKVYDGTTAANVTGSGIIGGDAVTVNATGGFASANVGNGITVNVSGVSLAGADAGNYTVSGGGSISTTANITPAPLTVTANAASKTYDGQAYSGNAGASYSGFVNSETSAVLGGSLSYSGSSQGAINAGSYVITPQGLTAGNYSLTYVGGALTVNPATLTYTANSASRTYGASNPSLGGTVTGFVNGETLSGATTGTAGFSTAATSASNVGSYAVNGSGLSANNGNYTFVQAAGNSTALSVNPAVLTVTASNDSKTYNGLAYSGGHGVSYSGFVNGDTSSALGGSLSYAGTSQGAINAGSYVITPQGLSSGNYSLSYVSGSLTVNPATLSYTANGASRTYGASNPSLSGTVTGFVNGETISSATTGTAGFSTAATSASNVGSYAVNGSGLTANHGNYTFVQAGGNSSALTVTPATLTVTAANASKTYDSNAYSGGNGVSYSGFVNGDTAAVLSGAVSYGGTSQGAVNVGSYTIVPSGLSASNYTLSYANGSLAVSPANLTLITGSLTGSITKVYDGGTLATLAPGNYLLSGWQGNDGATVTKTTGTYDTANVGSNKTVTVSLSSGDFSATGNTVLSNYQLPTSVTGSIGGITPAPLTIMAATSTKTYDGGVGSTATPTVSGLVGGDTVTGLSQVYANKNAGTGKTISVSGYTLNDGNNGGNYTVSTVESTSSTIIRAEATVTGSATHASYNGGTQTQGPASRSGFLDGDNISVAGLASGRNAGTYHSSLSVGGSDADNYHITVTNADLVIGRAALTVTAAQDSKVYDGGVGSALTPTVSGLAGSDTVTGLSQVYVNKNAGTGKTISVGTYTVNDGNNGSNYNVTTVDNTSSVVTPATLTVSVDGASRSAGTGNPVFTGTVTGFVGTDNLANATTGTLTFASEADTTSPTGSYAVLGRGLSALHGNYVLTQAQGNARALTVTKALPVVDQFLPKAAPVPNFPDNALHALGATSNAIGAGNLNYVSLDSGGSTTPAMPSFGTPVGGAGTANNAAIGTSTSASEPGSNVTAASPNRTSGENNAAGNASSGGSRGRTARPGSAGTAVPSANGPLDIFVIDGGINAGTGTPTGNQAK